jgi:hypothetical protein
MMRKTFLRHGSTNLPDHAEEHPGNQIFGEETCADLGLSPA